MKKKILLALGAVLLMFSLVIPPSALAINVGTEILLLADVSGSLDGADFALQRDGYAAAFRDADIIDAIVAHGGIAVSLVYWSTGQSLAVDWMHVYDATTAEALAQAIENAPRPSSGSTYMADAMNYGVGLFANDYDSEKQVVDVSGDGANNEVYGAGINPDPDVQAARDNLVNLAGVDMINALFIDDRDYFGDDPEDLINAYDYGVTNVIYGTGSFVEVVEDYVNFAEAINEKIYREIIPTPEPATMLLLAFGLLGLASFRRKE